MHLTSGPFEVFDLTVFTQSTQALKEIESLRRSSIPDYYKLFLSISKTGDGIGFLVGARSDILVKKFDAVNNWQFCSDIFLLFYRI